MEERLFYRYLDHSITTVFLVSRSETGCLVYASLGSNRKELLKIAQLDFQKLTRKTKVSYGLYYDVNDSMLNLEQSFASYLDGSFTGAIPHEYIFGTRFQRKVWDELSKVKIGETTTYQTIAQAIGSPKACRAVGSAVGANRIAVIVPCHRCKPCDGSLGNFRWGTQLKNRLL
ncbi:hypothetical protein ZYGR_0AF03360 [Zygosaccharomyces rouxii]|uniref:Methylated-DNA--protein-cysteine methyltransferase n=1 Tax=Zygosaccharomyces rouxii TaxID=4956 RepID=A0A1Q3A7Z5_ZYGRO|nr:hypothetical protein ZYGR_0AF03360 [Zygosaccharomyces rouxii]